MYAIVCLGNEPLVIGPFEDEKATEDELWMHIDTNGSCPNGIEKQDHHVLPMLEGFFQVKDD